MLSWLCSAGFLVIHLVCTCPWSGEPQEDFGWRAPQGSLIQLLLRAETALKLEQAAQGLVHLSLGTSKDGDATSLLDTCCSAGSPS